MLHVFVISAIAPLFLDVNADAAVLPESKLINTLTDQRTAGADLYNQNKVKECIDFFTKALADARTALSDYPDLQTMIDDGSKKAAANAKPEDHAFALHDLVIQIRDEIKKIDGPAPLLKRADEAHQKRDLDRAASLYKKVLAGLANRKAEEPEAKNRNVPMLDESVVTAAAAYYGLGRVSSNKKHDEEAIKLFTEAIQRNEKKGDYWRSRGEANGRLGNITQMLEDFHKAIEVEPTSHSNLDEIAWRLATSPNPDIRNGKKALEYAQKACELTENKDLWYFDTVAAAHAELGEFDKAVEAVRKIINAPGKLTENQLKGVRARMAEYEKRRPYRDIEPPPSGNEFALTVLTPPNITVKIESKASGGQNLASLETVQAPSDKSPRAVYLGRAADAAETSRTVKVQLKFPVDLSTEQLDLEYNLKRGQAKYVNAAGLIDEWKQILKRLPQP